MIVFSRAAILLEHELDVDSFSVFTSSEISFLFIYLYVFSSLLHIVCSSTMLLHIASLEDCSMYPFNPFILSVRLYI